MKLDGQHPQDRGGFHETAPDGHIAHRQQLPLLLEATMLLHQTLVTCRIDVPL